MRTDPKYLTLDDLLQKRLFQIPEYQRAYSWETKQRKDLFNDIDKLVEIRKTQPDRHHFMATIVCLDKTEKIQVGTDDYSIYDVVDGQQRITTLIILLKEISKALNNINKVEAERLDDLLVKDDKRLLLLQTNHDSARIFRNYLENGKIPDGKVATLADQNLIEAFKECNKYVEVWKHKANILDLLRIIKNYMAFIFYVSVDEGAVFNTFEVLNSRGLDVNWLDKCKTMLMGIAYEKLPQQTAKAYTTELQMLWANIFRTIGIKLIPGDEILQFVATLKHDSELSKPLSSVESLEFIRRKCSDDPKLIITYSEWLLMVSEELKELYSDPRISGVTIIKQARLLAVALMIVDKWDGKLKDEALHEWEKVTFRIYGLGRKDARNKVGEYTKLAYAVVNKYNSPGREKEVIKRIKQIAIESEYDINNVVNNLRNSDCFTKWRKEELRYFLYHYEEYLENQNSGAIDKDIWIKVWSGTASSTIEHVRPQKWNARGWSGVLGRTKESVESNVNRLGNLVLLPPNVNSRARDKSFKKKKEIYMVYRSLLQVDEIINYKTWNAKAIKKREEKMLAWAIQNWG